jgi:hypothetical protein
VTRNMKRVVKGLDKTMEAINLERVCLLSSPSSFPSLNSPLNPSLPSTTDLPRNGQIRGSVFRLGRTDVVRRCDGFYDGDVDTTGHADAPDAGRCQTSPNWTANYRDETFSPPEPGDARRKTIIMAQWRFSRPSNSESVTQRSCRGRDVPSVCRPPSDLYADGAF